MRITETARIIISMGEKIDALQAENEQLKAVIALYGLKDIVKEQREELVELGVINENATFINVEQMAKKYPVRTGFEFSSEDRQKLYDAFEKALNSMEIYDPYSIGYKLFEDGHGISSIAGAVKCDADMNECQRGYDDALATWRKK